MGSTDQDRIRHLTVALPPRYAARLFDAQEAGASGQQLQQIAADALKEVYFQDGGRRAGSLEEVRFTDVEHLEFDLWPEQPASPDQLAAVLRTIERPRGLGVAESVHAVRVALTDWPPSAPRRHGHSLG